MCRSRLLDDYKEQDGNVGVDDAPADRLARAVAKWPPGRRAEELHTIEVEDTLFHGEALLVVAAWNAEDVILSFVFHRVARVILP